MNWKPYKKYPHVCVKFGEFSRSLIRDCKRGDWDKVILVTGGEGVSKSTCTYHISRLFEQTKDYKWRDHFMLSPKHEELIKQIKKKVKTSIVIDEAIKVLYKLKMWDDLQLLINQIYTVNRQNNNLSCINIPRHNDLAKYFRDGRAHYWIQVIERGVANIFVKDESQFSDDVWCYKENLKLEKKLSKNKLFTFLTTEQKIWIHSKMRNYIGTIYYDDIPLPDREDYKAQKRKEEYEGLNIQIRSKTSKIRKQRDSLIYELMQTGEYTQVKIANILDMESSHISKLLRNYKDSL
jgi:hypothetical protein